MSDERLTQRNSIGGAYYPYCFQESTCYGMGASVKCNGCEFNNEVLEKLATYEDLEEQGLLLRLPMSDGFTDDLLNMGYTKGYHKAIDEFAEKLIERLEERKEHFSVLIKVGEDDLVLNNNLGRMCAYEDTIEIVNQLAEEYINTSSEHINCSTDDVAQAERNKVIEILERFCDAECNGLCYDCEIPSLIERLKKEGYNNGWISVKDSLPSDEKEYLVTLRDGEVTSAKYDKEEKVWVDTIEEYYEYPVIAWQSLPAPYKEGE